MDIPIKMKKVQRTGTLILSMIFILIIILYKNYSNGRCTEPKSKNYNSKYCINEMDRFDWYSMKNQNSSIPATEVSTLYAYKFEHEITITLSSWKFIGYRVHCRYVDKDGAEIGRPYETFSYPEFVVNCPKRDGTYEIGLSVEEFGSFKPLPIIYRVLKKPLFELSMCVAPLYGDEPKWLMFIEMIEHYKLQGVEHFYNYIHEISDYDSKVIDYYAGLGIVENHYLLEKGLRTDRHRHINEVVDCNIWSRGHSKWTIFADLDERLVMTDYPGTILNYIREVDDEKIGSLKFRQQWILKTELMPQEYEGKDQLLQWMAAHRWHNSTGIARPGHTTKCIVDSTKVFIMSIHLVIEFFPGNGYYEKELKPEEGLVRHYRDQSLGEWGEKWLKTVMEFGPLRNTDYPRKYIGNLTENVVNTAAIVYGNLII
ncbi:Glycosyltransferase family 92 protein [Caenorhabditis elegans]|uniref:Glycosyltransferase family 92 protein n=1 Tax=Caenorhabditis elegans TaxID=6239 RepID=O16536_CAEEL|nr:Glycosyltransferase family 92 protein [Caenorhabditis elegans]CCD64791.1 Glycosyltransferase family 92 protein [Caenorhabditis elegans]|eukprot:NP_494670.1 Uncharacterized protein CELE_C17A2.2 [Caenorhabditis elegans]